MIDWLFGKDWKYKQMLAKEGIACTRALEPDPRLKDKKWLIYLTFGIKMDIVEYGNRGENIN